MRPNLHTLARFLDRFLAIDQARPAQRELSLPSSPTMLARPVTRLGLALEPWPGLRDWVTQEQLDAVFLHRPWGIERSHLPDDVGVLAYPQAFDACLTVGWNPRLRSCTGRAEPVLCKSKPHLYARLPLNGTTSAL